MIRFVGRFLFNPASIGAILPSSRLLAKAMTKQIAGSESIFEIGAGTGAITRQLKIAGREPLAIFEQDRHLAAYLRRTLVEGKVIEGWFHEKIGTLAEIPEDLVILSSVPFNSLPANLHLCTVDAICRLLLTSPKRRLVQYSYFDRPPFVPIDRNLCWHRRSRVWANIPPATVWELKLNVEK